MMCEPFSNLLRLLANVISEQCSLGETTSMLNLQGEVLVVSSFTTCLGCGGCDYAVLM
jgi:hypothetical protein